MSAITVNREALFNTNGIADPTKAAETLQKRIDALQERFETELKQLDVSDTDIALIDAKAVLFAREKMLKKEIHKKRMQERAQKPLVMRFTKVNGKWVSKVNK